MSLTLRSLLALLSLLALTLLTALVLLSLLARRVTRAALLLALTHPLVDGGESAHQVASLRQRA